MNSFCIKIKQHERIVKFKEKLITCKRHVLKVVHFTSLFRRGRQTNALEWNGRAGPEERAEIIFFLLNM